MGAGALAICQNKAAVRLREDMKKVVSQPLVKQKSLSYRKVFGVSLPDLQQQGLVKEGVPAVLWHMVEYLKETGLKQEGLFRVNGSVKVVEQLRLKLESGEEAELIKDGDVCSVASLLKLFLRELPDGVITSALHPKFMQLYQVHDSNEDVEKGIKGLLVQLPRAHYCLLKYLCCFLTQVAEHCEANRMTIMNLATVFGPNVFQ
ncbi:protein FAM13A-like [Latimeria chalumnae]|uniref:protein FAM13A-like n=1 Tax=Latimeria chalumnae TaxID=7897 RepID=UPI0006D90696|nr:PREDICTED: protein FAM13A-like isoform X1 [Latimeria chalumnae]|eukprot:XP_014349422.1 PREDICTED: protein FAM13A-like isoform X1 [Latimeria chalumnae]